MKTRLSLLTLMTAAGIGALPVSPAPAEPAEPAAADAAAADNAPAFLGVGVAESPAPPAPPAAAASLPERVLVVSQVAPGSPAEDAGLRPGDALLEINGQHLLHPVQLQRLVALIGVGQDVELTLMRGPDRLTLTTRLAPRPANLAAAPDPLEIEPWALRDDLQGDLDQMRRQMDQQFEQMRQMFRRGMGEGWPGGAMWERGAPIQLDLGLEGLPAGRVTQVFQDPEHKLTLTQTPEGRHLLATDTQGKVLFDGPIDTDAQFQEVPAALRDKIPAAGAPGAIQLRFGPAPGDFLGPAGPEASPDQEEHPGPGEPLAPPRGSAV